MITNIEQLKQEAIARARDADLQWQCGMDGAFNSKIAIVAEAPGEREITLGRPLIGGAGKVLWDALRKYKINRNQVYITNVIKRRAASGEIAGKAGANELQHWGSLLRWELCQLPYLETVLVLGGPALMAVCGEAPITQWRGSVLTTTLRDVKTFVDDMPKVINKEVTCVVAYNPAMILRMPREEIAFRMDMHKLHRVINGTYETPAVISHYDPSPSQAVEWIDKMHDEKLPISLDIETISGETACVGLANNTEVGYCINWRSLDENRWSIDEERNVRKHMQRLLVDPSTRYVMQNGMYDTTWMWFKDKMQVHKVWFDTMLAHHTLYSSLPHNLGFLTSQYTDHPYYKDEGKDWREGGNISQFWEYNCKDVCITLQCQQRMLEELRKFGQEDFFFNHVMRLHPHLVRNTVGGMLVDLSLKDKIADEIGADVYELEEKFKQLARDAAFDQNLNVNPRSPKQLSELFFKRLRLIGKGMSTDAANRKRMRDHPSTASAAREMLTALDTFAHENKFLGTYAKMTIDADGRVRTEYKQTGVREAPGRLSSSQTGWGSGANLQNQPERAYPMFIADEGFCLVYFDLAQAEARVVAYLANILVWIEQFERARLDGSYDCHRALASEMFGVPYEEVPTADREADGTVTLRFIAKRCRHGLNYRMDYPRLAETTGLPLSRAREAYHLYHSSTPELRQWWATLEEEVRTNRYLVSPKGRVLRILERLSPEAMESIVAFKPQSTIGDHVCEVFYRSEDDDDWPHNARMLLNIHDALVALSPIEHAHIVAEIMRKNAERPLLIDSKQLIIPADFKVSTADEQGIHRWSTLKSCTPDTIMDVVRMAA